MLTLRKFLEDHYKDAKYPILFKDERNKYYTLTIFGIVTEGNFTYFGMPIVFCRINNLHGSSFRSIPLDTVISSWGDDYISDFDNL